VTLSAGIRLGPYEVQGRLGAGGMGEVWRARDSRLSRDVAIKVLPAEVASDVGRLKRFEKEARSASALNHPNIVTIYDIGSHDSVSYIAMELVDGKTLRELLYAGALPTKRVLNIAAQFADGLARAHEAGIVHRDLKPENIMVTKDGRVKILDFGLAKLTYTGVESGEGTNIATETGTGADVILGTVAYMSPEQASGHPVDYRSDQFWFGSILYELVTGKRAFVGKTGVDTLSAILNDEPAPIATLNPQAPAALRWIVERCLAKAAEDRYASTLDLARDLASIRDHLSEAGVTALVSSAPASRRRPALLVGGAVLAAAAIALAALLAGKNLAHPPLPSFQQLTFRRGHVGAARFTPDGQTIVFSPSWEGQPTELYETRIGGPESRPLGLRGFVLSVSSSGEIALSLPGQTLAVVPLGGGSPWELLEKVSEADWSPDGKNLAVLHRVAGRNRLEYPIGKVLYETTNRIDNLLVSRKGDRIALRELSGRASGGVYVVDLAGKKKPLGIRTSEFAWSPGDEELWFLHIAGGQSEVRAISLAGRQRLIARLPGTFQLDDVSRDGRMLLERFSNRGEIECLAPGQAQKRSLSWLDSSWAADLSDDGKTLLIDEGGRGETYLRGTDGSPAKRLGEGKPLSLSPDGKWVLALRPTSPPNLILLPGGVGETRVLQNKNFESYSFAEWLPDGKRFLFCGTERGHQSRLYVEDSASEEFHPISPEGIALGFPIPPAAVSPDGKWVFAEGNEGWALHPIEHDPASAPRPIAGLSNGDVPIGWTADGGSLFIQDDQENPARVYRLNLATGRKQPFRDFSPTDIAGIRASIVQVTPDGKSWAYTYVRTLSDLYLAEGLK
jgi:Tol biopolymer transport system component/predicted Ser/Thr protein kinase